MAESFFVSDKNYRRSLRIPVKRLQIATKMFKSKEKFKKMQKF